MKELKEPWETGAGTVGLEEPWLGRDRGRRPSLTPLGRRPLHRSRKGMIFGVCKGLAEYADLPVFWIRLIVVGLTLLSWVLPFVILYTVAAFLMKPEPILEAEAERDWKDYTAYACDQSAALARLKRELDELEHQTLRLDRLAHARQFDWEQRLKRGD